MAIYDIFNGDADGITALIQMRLANPQASTLVTGVKRDIALVKTINAVAGDTFNILDISLQKNHEAVTQALASGIKVFYTDHHAAGETIEHANFTSLINTAPDVCTSLLINGYLKNAYAQWAVVGAFGDNLKTSACALANTINLSQDNVALLDELGVLINYNAYGETLDDLHFSPADLYRKLYDFSSPLDFINSQENNIFEQLKQAYADDMNSASSTAAYYSDENVTVFVLPEASWARRINGVWGNALANQHVDKAHAVCVEKRDGTLTVSVRAPLNNKQGAGDFCAQFEGGGGRAAAGGINHLAKSDLDLLSTRFAQFYAG